MSDKPEIPLPKIALIAAVSKNGIIGRDGDMPWRLSTDLKRFKKITLGCPIIAGRKTFQSFGGSALPGRQNIVISRQPQNFDGTTPAKSLDEALTIATVTAINDQKQEIFIVGGGEIYKMAIGQADRLYITHIDAEVEGDTQFPTIDSDIWTKTNEELVPAGDKDNYPTRFVIYDRK